MEARSPTRLLYGPNIGINARVTTPLPAAVPTTLLGDNETTRYAKFSVKNSKINRTSKPSRRLILQQGVLIFRLAIPEYFRDGRPSCVFSGCEAWHIFSSCCFDLIIRCDLQ